MWRGIQCWHYQLLSKWQHLFYLLLLLHLEIVEFLYNIHEFQGICQMIIFHSRSSHSDVMANLSKLLKNILWETWWLSLFLPKTVNLSLTTNSSYLGKLAIGGKQIAKDEGDTKNEKIILFLLRGSCLVPSEDVVISCKT